MDPIAFASEEHPAVSQGRGGTPYTSTGLADCLREGAKAFGWSGGAGRRAEPTCGQPVRRGVGVAAGMWARAGRRPAVHGHREAVQRRQREPQPGRERHRHGHQDGHGDGGRRGAARADRDSIQIEHADTGTTQFATPSGGSKTMPDRVAADPRRGARGEAQLLEMAATQLGCRSRTWRSTEGKVVSTSDPARSVAVTGPRGVPPRAA